MKAIQEPMDRVARSDRLNSFQASLIYISTGLGSFVSAGGAVWYYQGFLLGFLALMLAFAISIQSGWSYARVSFLTDAYTVQDAYLITFGKKSQAILNFFQSLISLFLCIGCLYVAGTCLKGFFAQLSDYKESVWFSEAMCVIYISIFVLPFTFRKQVKSVRIAAIIQISSLLAFTIVTIIFFAKHKPQIESKHPGLRIPVLPEYSFSLVFIKFIYLANSSAFAWGTLAVIHSQKPQSLKQAFYPMIYAMALVTLFFGLISYIAMATFKQLLLNHDTILKAFYVYSHSFLAQLAQIIFCFISAFHTPVFLFNCRESFLIFLCQICQFNQPSPHSLPAENQEETHKLVSPDEPKERFPIMYERVPAWVFYTTASCICVVNVALAILLRNIQTYFEVLILPYIICISLVFGNLLLVKINGVKKERFALSCLIFGVILAVLAFIFAIIDLIR